MLDCYRFYFEKFRKSVLSVMGFTKPSYIHIQGFLNSFLFFKLLHLDTMLFRRNWSLLLTISIGIIKMKNVSLFSLDQFEPSFWPVIYCKVLNAVILTFKNKVTSQDNCILSIKLGG